MATLEESMGAKTPLGSDLAAGLETLDLNQEITFILYVRLVLPLDGYVFWVRADLVGPSALPNVLMPNLAGPNYEPKTLVAARTLVAKGSMHYATELRQEADETYAANRMVFTSEQEINDLSRMAPNTLWIGEFDGKRFAFSSRSSFYRQADLFHYVGFAVYSDMATQIIDSKAGFDGRRIVVSNSLPAWLAMNGLNPPFGFGNPSLTLFPSFLVPDNLFPPYAAVDIPPAGTRALAAAPTIDRKTSTHTQLCADLVKITLWGTRNDDALDFVDAVYQYSENVGAFGIMNVPVVRDEKRTQSELQTIAMKKTVEFEVSYLQHRVRDVAQQIIASAIPNFFVDGVPG